MNGERAPTMSTGTLGEPATMRGCGEEEEEEDPMNIQWARSDLVLLYPHDPTHSRRKCSPISSQKRKQREELDCKSRRTEKRPHVPWPMDG